MTRQFKKLAHLHNSYTTTQRCHVIGFSKTVTMGEFRFAQAMICNSLASLMAFVLLLTRNFE